MTRLVLVSRIPNRVLQSRIPTQILGQSRTDPDRYFRHPAFHTYHESRPLRIKGPLPWASRHSFESRHRTVNIKQRATTAFQVARHTTLLAVALLRLEIKIN